MTVEWVILQLADSAFPCGGFVHSGGLESASQWGLFRENGSLFDFVQTSVVQLGYSSVPFLKAAHRDANGIKNLDGLCDAFLSNQVANRASRLRGQSFLIAADAAFQLEICGRLRSQLGAGRLAGHFAPIFGAVTAALRLQMEEAIQLLLFAGLRDLVSSAVRLNVIGPLSGQSVQFR